MLATVTCGLYISWNGLRLISAPTRLQGIFFNGTSGNEGYSAGHEDILRQLLRTEREQMIELYRTGRLKDEPRRRIELDLDLREAQMANLPTP